MYIGIGKSISTNNIEQQKLKSLNQKAEIMKIVTLVDNRKTPDSILEVEHGLCFYIEIGQKKLLLDVGASDIFLKNANKLNINIADVDYLILSHAHKDHTGGLECFLQNNYKAQIYVSSHISESGYYSIRRGQKRNISIDYNLIKEYESRFNKVATNIQLLPSINIISQIPIIYSIPKANKTLLVGNDKDDFNHEIALLLRSKNESVLFSSCSHLGLLNTLKACTDEKISYFFGGLHLINSENPNTFETKEELIAIGETIESEYPDLNIYTGHCTGSDAQDILSKILPDRFFTFYTGFEIDI